MLISSQQYHPIMQRGPHTSEGGRGTRIDHQSVPGKVQGDLEWH